MKKIMFSTIVFLSIAVSSCKKESAKVVQVCYQCQDFSGNDLEKVCGTSHDDAYSQLHGQNLNGSDSVTVTQFDSWCHKVQ